MADGVVGTEIATGFSTGVAGETPVVAVATRGGVTFAGTVSFAEIGTAGDYLLKFTPTVAADHYARWTGNLSGAEFTETWRVVTATQFDPLSEATIDRLAATTGFAVTVRPP